MAASITPLVEAGEAVFGEVGAVDGEAGDDFAEAFLQAVEREVAVAAVVLRRCG